MVERTNPYNDVIRRQQEKDIGHPLDHAKSKRGAPPAELLNPVEPTNPNRRPIDSETGKADIGRDALRQQEE
jgi:hypothetical protein